MFETLNLRHSTHKIQNKKKTLFSCLLLHMHIANTYQNWYHILDGESNSCAIFSTSDSPLFVIQCIMK